MRWRLLLLSCTKLHRLVLASSGSPKFNKEIWTTIFILKFPSLKAQKDILEIMTMHRKKYQKVWEILMKRAVPPLRNIWKNSGIKDFSNCFLIQAKGRWLVWNVISDQRIPFRLRKKIESLCKKTLKGFQSGLKAWFYKQNQCIFIKELY